MKDKMNQTGKTPKKRIKVALFLAVANEKNLDGATMSIYTILDLMPKEKVEFLIVTAKAPEKDNPKFPYKYITEPHVTLPLYKDYPISLPWINNHVRKSLDTYNPDIIHITTPFFSGPWALKYAKKRNIPVLTIYHTHFLTYIEYYVGKFKPLYWFIRKTWERHFRKFYNSTQIALIPTSGIKEELEKLGINSEKMKIWGRGINLQIFKPRKDKSHIRDHVTKNDKKNILFVSRLSLVKELKTLVRVYKEITETRQDVNFIIAGDGPQRDYLKKRMPKAIFLGKQKQVDLTKLYASSEVFIFPSITETFGNVVLEAMACGCPPVVAAAGGPKGIVVDGINGLHAKPKDAKDFTRQINRVLDDAEFRDVLSKNAIDYAKKQSWENLTDELLSHYSSLALDES